MKVLVTGARGMLGKDLCPLLDDCGYDVIECGRNEFDITDYSAVKCYIEKTNPELIIHCAAYTNVDKAEEDPLNEAVNANGTENLAKICAERNIPLVYISTDYVFDGTKETPYTPQDTTNPLNAYGLSKLHGEEAVQKHCKKYYIIRTSWLYGHHGKNFVETMISLADKPSLKVVNDQTGCPTWTVDLSNAIIDLIEEEEEPYGIYHICGGGHTTWYGFANEIFKQCGLQVNLNPCTTDEFPRPAKRPKYSIMDNQGRCRDWKQALNDYIELRVE